MTEPSSMTPPKDRKTPKVEMKKLTPEDVADLVVRTVGEMETRFNKRLDIFETQASEALTGAGQMLQEAIGIMREALNHAIAVNQKSDAAVADLREKHAVLEARVKILEGKVG